MTATTMMRMSQTSSRRLYKSGRQVCSLFSIYPSEAYLQSTLQLQSCGVLPMPLYAKRLCRSLKLCRVAQHSGEAVVVVFFREQRVCSH